MHRVLAETGIADSALTCTFAVPSRIRSANLRARHMLSPWLQHYGSAGLMQGRGICTVAGGCCSQWHHQFVCVLGMHCGCTWHMHLSHQPYPHKARVKPTGQCECQRAEAICQSLAGRWTLRSCVAIKSIKHANLLHQLPCIRLNLLHTTSFFNGCCEQGNLPHDS